VLDTISSETNMDEVLVRRQIREALDAAGGCPCELIMKDNTTLGRKSGNVKRWVEIAQEEIGENASPARKNR
jgi:hypothetical protein